MEIFKAEFEVIKSVGERKLLKNSWHGYYYFPVYNKGGGVLMAFKLFFFIDCLINIVVDGCPHFFLTFPHVNLSSLITVLLHFIIVAFLNILHAKTSNSLSCFCDVLINFLIFLLL